MGIVAPVAGGGIGVLIPLGTEYALKGGRLGATEAEPTKGYKWSGILGLVQGILGVGVAAASQAWGKPKLSDDLKNGFAAMGGAGLATGGSILVLDELRKRGQYAFKKNVDLRGRGREGLEEYERKKEIIEPLVEEI